MTLSVTVVIMATPSPTIVSILVFGLPAEEVEATLGLETPPAFLISIDAGGDWVRGIDFVKSLEGKIVDSGRSYRIRPPVHLVHCISPNETKLILREPGRSLSEGVIKPSLKVVGISSDPLRLAYQRDGKWFSTYSEFTLQDDGGFKLMYPGRTKRITRSGYFGDYVLQNGQMVEIEEGKYAPQAMEANARVMLNSRVYEASIVYIYSFPLDR